MGGVVKEKIQVGTDLHLHREVRISGEELVEVLFCGVDGDGRGIH